MLFIISLFLSIGFPSGILMIVFGASKNITYLLVLGIIFTVLGFYVMPILWVKYAEKRQYRTILYLITEEKIHTIADLASQTNYDQERLKQIVNALIMSKYLVHYLYRDGVLTENANIHKTKNNVDNKCSNCGGHMRIEGDNLICDYCGNRNHKI